MPKAPDAPLGRSRILVVEDEVVLQRFYRCFFEDHHAQEFSWRLAKDGAEALQALEAAPPDLILLDWMLPAVPGSAVLQAIRAHPRTRRLGVLVVTAKSGPGDAALALESGADDYLAKPFDNRVLLARLRSLCRRQQALRAVEAQWRRSQKLETLGLLAGGVIHDFDDVLTVIDGRSRSILQALAPDAAGRGDAEELQKAVDRASSLTRQLLAFTRQQEPRPARADLNELVETLAPMLRRLIGDEIELVVTRDAGLRPLQADPDGLAQVLLNIALNARDAMPQGGRLAITTANRVLTEETRERHKGLRAGPYAALTVADTGSGMFDEVRRRLFEPFFTNKGPGRGTGVGLSSAQDIVQRNGGEIIVHSESGAGCRFEVLLPQAADEKPAEPRAGL